jgi:hypothetical protein
MSPAADATSRFKVCHSVTIGIQTSQKKKKKKKKTGSNRSDPASGTLYFIKN